MALYILSQGPLEPVKREKNRIASSDSPYFLKLSKQNDANHLIFGCWQAECKPHLWWLAPREKVSFVSQRNHTGSRGDTKLIVSRVNSHLSVFLNTSQNKIPPKIKRFSAPVFNHHWYRKITLLYLLCATGPDFPRFKVYHLITCKGLA